jgi:malate dehydrogenase (oxaloacetate-decarboxylating)(NADP+)
MSSKMKKPDAGIQSSKKSLRYHRIPTPGKITIVPSKPCETQEDLSLAYSPGVAAPCIEIESNPQDVYEYTSKGNLVAVISDGTAVLGLGNIGPEAAVPVMEGKAVLFKRFAGIDAIPLCISDVFLDDGRTDPDRFIETVLRLEPSFGGINLEDIAAPACFDIEEQLKRKMSIPVFHDDQHGTAIICLAGILNSLSLTGKKIEDIRIVVNGAGAAGITCTRMCLEAGAGRENIILCDSKGVIHSEREAGMSSQKREFALSTNLRCLKDAMQGADVFLGLSCGNCVDRKMVSSMGHDPIVFAMANPVPEIFPEEALAAGAAVVGTGRSDYPNQVNNVLGFPGIFRGALDVRARNINEEMKMAAARGLMEIAGEEIPSDVREHLAAVYPSDFQEGIFEGINPLKRRYVIPKPFDPRVVPRVARKVAEAAMKSGAASLKIEDLDTYESSVSDLMSSQ